ncbi:ABC transporter ATP-binding protein [Mameliella sp.]|uniref:ABC transporter ATP-binding protein n=1 Tax=Mameliella sp. TaxID=1924940 RepID=UPI003BACFAEA
MTDDPIIHLSGVDKRFGTFKAVDKLDLKLKAGEFFSLLGPSGCGKTTALRIIAGFQEPTAGTVRIDGQDMAGIPANKRPTNMVFQSYAIFPHLNVGHNVGFGLVKQGLSRQARRDRIAEALEMVELGGMENRKADQLSGGQRQRVALARALVMRPKVLLLDEPLSALDKNLREAMQLELRRLQQSIGITFVMVTHDQYEAMTMSDRIGVMFNGRLEQVDAPATLYARPANRDVAAFIGGMNFLPARSADQSGETIAVELPGFGKIKIQRNANVTKRGSELLVGIRPEQLDISRERPTDYDATLEAKVENVAFYGESVHYHVRAEGVPSTIVVAVPNYFHTVDFNRGDTVFIGVQSASVIDLGNDSQTQNIENGEFTT